MRKLLLLAVLISASLPLARSEVHAVEAGDSDFRAFISQWEAVQSRFINGDATLWKQNASHREDATIFGAFGGYEKGWKEVGPRYDWASAQFKDSGATQEIEYLNMGVSGDLAFTVGIEHQRVRLSGAVGSAPRALRVTQIFRKERGTWKLLHRHADPLMEKKAPSEVR